MPWLPEIHRFPSVGTPIGRALGVEPPECRVQNGRTTLTFRRLGATRWSEAQQMEFARRAVTVARSVLADDDRGQLRRGARRAIVIVFEDASVVQDCAVVARWECTVPSPPGQ